MKLNEIDLFKLQTTYMRNDETTRAMCIALSPELNKIDVNKCLVMFNIDTLSEEILDEIALSENIFWYDSNASVEVKRNIIKNADSVFKYLGTDYAMEKVIIDYFGDGEIKSWFDYNGTPGHFKVYTSNKAATDELTNQFNTAIAFVKRKSSILDEVVVNMVENYNIYNGFALHVGDNMIFKQEVI